MYKDSYIAKIQQQILLMLFTCVLLYLVVPHLLQDLNGRIHVEKKVSTYIKLCIFSNNNNSQERRKNTEWKKNEFCVRCSSNIEHINVYNMYIWKHIYISKQIDGCACRYTLCMLFLPQKIIIIIEYSSCLISHSYFSFFAMLLL